MEKFQNPAHQFVGAWQVHSHDWHEFSSVPTDFEKQIAVEASYLPVGQKIQINSIGLSFMPGNYNSKKMNFDGPVGETLEITFLTPFKRDLCRGYWSYLCIEDTVDYIKNFMIVEIVEWDVSDQARRLMWPNVKPVEYRLVDLSKSHNINAWFDKEGDIIFPVVIDGQSRRGRDFGILGVRLKRVN